MSQFIITEDIVDYDEKIQWILNAFVKVFPTQEHITGKHHSLICDRLGVINTWHPLYKQGNYKKYTEEEIKERLKEQKDNANKKYEQTEKGKILRRKIVLYWINGYISITLNRFSNFLYFVLIV